MHQIKSESTKIDFKEEQHPVAQSTSNVEIPDETTSGGSTFFIQIISCSIMILGILFMKYIQPNTIFEEKIKHELTQTITIEEVKQFICELEEMSDKYWRIK